jgi:hypothetical protein
VAVEPPPVNVVVVTLPGDQAASLVALEWAAFAADHWTATALVVASSHPTISDLRAACASAATQALRQRLSLYPLAPDEGEQLGAVPLSIAIVVAEGSAVTVPTWGRRTFTVLAVSSGFATAEKLAAVTLACIEAGHPIQGVLVANPDPGDHTTGRVELLVPPGADLGAHQVRAHDVRPALPRGTVADGAAGVTAREAAP